MDQDLDDKAPSLGGLQETLRRYRSLVESQGWAELHEVAQAQATAREGPVLRSATEAGNVGEHNFMKGEACGIRSLLALPYTIIEQTEGMILELKEKADDEPEVPAV